MKKQIKFLFVSLFLVFLSSCSDEFVIKKSEKLQLRQMVQSEDKERGSSGYFLFGIGSYQEYETNEPVIRVFAKVGGSYRFIEIPLDKLDVNILSDSTTIPYLELKYRDRKDDPDMKAINILSNNPYNPYLLKRYVINCPDKYLPEDLIPINLNK